MHILLVEDNPADAFLTREALGQGTVNNGKVTVVMDGQEALSFLHQAALAERASLELVTGIATFVKQVQGDPDLIFVQPTFG